MQTAHGGNRGDCRPKKEKRALTREGFRRLAARVPGGAQRTMLLLLPCVWMKKKQGDGRVRVSEPFSRQQATRAGQLDGCCLLLSGMG